MRGTRMVTFLDQFACHLRSILLFFNWNNILSSLKLIKSFPKLIILSPPKWYWCFFFRKNPISGISSWKFSRFIPFFWVSEGKNENFRIQAIGDNPKPNRHIIYEPKIPMQRPLYHKTYNDMLLLTPFSAKSFYTWFYIKKT